MARTKNHLLDAVKSIAAAQAQLEQTVAAHTKILDNQGQEIAALERQVMKLRNSAIQAEVAAGAPTKFVAEKYGVSPGRVSQIAPRSRLN